MKLSKIHRTEQSNWLKEYIDFSTEKRKNSNYSFERSFFKLLVNTIYGKMVKQPEILEKGLMFD